MVPNLPCGVERIFLVQLRSVFPAVPNLPCGVERFFILCSTKILLSVPNLPCGVERALPQALPHRFCNWFLIYRVELKVYEKHSYVKRNTRFLIYRVELKGTYCFYKLLKRLVVFLIYRVELKGQLFQSLRIL